MLVNRFMTNYDYLITLSKEQLSHLFVRLRFDSAEAEDWLEWMNMPYKEDEWAQILVQEDGTPLFYGQVENDAIPPCEIRPYDHLWDMYYDEFEDENLENEP